MASRREMLAVLKAKGISWERGNYQANDVLLLQYTKYIVNKQKTGDCYEVHAKAIIDGSVSGMLCHGTVWHSETGWHGHCWLEVSGDLVLDFSNGHQVLLPREVYYVLGNVKDVKRYSPEQARELIEKEGNYGTWETTGSVVKQEPKLEIKQREVTKLDEEKETDLAKVLKEKPKRLGVSASANVNRVEWHGSDGKRMWVVFRDDSIVIQSDDKLEVKEQSPYGYWLRIR